MSVEGQGRVVIPCLREERKVQAKTDKRVSLALVDDTGCSDLSGTAEASGEQQLGSLGDQYSLELWESCWAVMICM